MRLIWNIRMSVLGNGRYVVAIQNENGGRVRGEGRTPYDAYRAAEIQLVIKPACEWMKP